MSKNTIEIIINQTGNAVKGIGAVAGLFTGLASSAMGAIGPVVEIGKAVFEIGNAGAKVAQTKQSFDGLGVSLAALKKASGGTVDDMTLMSSTLTLMAGSTGALNSAFAEAAPGLLEMAKAASKLNPALGDTTSMYESLALGIKRGSPMILDNLGIIVSQETANRKYAESIGKTVAQLTDEEKKIALLNETLAKGNVLMEQAGGNTDSATDGFDRFKASLGNYTNAVKEAYSGTGGLFDALATGLETLAGWQQAWTEFLGITNAAAPSMSRLSAAIENSSSNIAVMNTEMMQATTVASQNQYALTATQDAIIKYDAAVRANIETMKAQHDAYMNSAAAISELGKQQIVTAQIDALNKAVIDKKITQEEATRATDALLVKTGLLTVEELALQNAIDSNLESFINNEIGIREYTDSVDSSLGSIQFMQDREEALADAIKTQAQPALDALDAALEAGKITAPQYAEAVAKLRAQMDALQDKTVTLTVNVKGDAQALANAGVAVNAPEKGGPAIAMQSGFNGIFTRPTMAIFGEGGPEQVTAQPLSNVTNNYNLSVNAMTAAASVVDDFNMMRAFAGRP